METLMKNLQEQHQLHLNAEQRAANDLANMYRKDERQPPLPPPRPKYVSIFRIDGEPILPPLMTTEKRRQMQKIKEKTLKVEQRLREQKQRVNKVNDEFSEDIVSETSRSSLANTAGNLSQRSQEYFEANLKETEESMMLLKNLLDKNENSIKKIDCGSNTTTDTPEILDENQEKLQKLRKSDILIYDNSTKEIIQVPPDKESPPSTRQLIELDRQTNLIYSKAHKPSHLLLAGKDGQGMTSIPSICLNPPTPLAVNRSISEQLQSSDSGKSIVGSEIFKKAFNLLEDSSDESCNSMLTQSQGRSSSSKRHNKPKHILQLTDAVRQKKPLKKSTIVLNKIQHYEDLSSESNTPKSSPEKPYHPRKACVMSRSATSPSIQMISSHRSSSSRSQNRENTSVHSGEISLVRSSSFTLEGPSKALIDHMRQQKTINEAKASDESQLNLTRTLTRKLGPPPLRAHRDTVESKAKKVQKVDLKQKLQQKTSQSKLSSAAVNSLSFYNSSSLGQKSSTIINPKKSPYDTSKYALKSLQKSTGSSSQLRKSVSTPSGIASTNKTTKSRISSSPMRTPPANKPILPKPPSIEKESFSQMDKIQKDKFLRLLAQQEEEHRRLQQSFEMQQKKLLEQLNREMVIQLQQSPPLKSPKSPTQKRPEHHQLPNKLQNQLNLKDLSSDTKSSDKPKQFNNGPQQQPQSPTISNKSFNISLNNSQTQSTSPHQSSFSKNSPQSPPSNAANTSLDLSTLSNQTSPVTLCPTTPTNIQSPSFNSGVNKSSSRRRLFPLDMTSTGDTIQLLSSRTTASSSFSSMQRMAEPAEHRIPLQKSSMNLSQNGGFRRQLYQQDDFIFHAAATRINACARGFLVRRLFQTEQIQRIVQTIRDTLIFVINLHLETLDNYEESNTPANIKLKARLLQQLSSACRTLHLVFFQTSIKERMEIIARDRKRIKTKLLAMNRKRTPRIAG